MTDLPRLLTGACNAPGGTLVTVNLTIWVPEAQEDSLGGFICRNDDDDDGTSGTDRDATRFPVTNDDPDLKKITLAVTPNTVPGNMKLIFDATKVKVWTSQKKAGAVLSDVTTWPVSSSPKDLWVEGYDTGVSLIKLVYIEGTPIPSSSKDCEDEAKVTVLKVDLDIDVDDDGDVDDDDEAKEESPGVIVFENWDNDDADSTNTPDKVETDVIFEDDLVPFYSKLEPTLTNGTLKLETTTGGSRVKVWSSKTKVTGTEIPLPKTWDLTTETVPTTLYLEGYDESTSANDVELKLSYANGGTSICDDKLKITVVRQNLGVAVYRDLNADWWMAWTAPLGHAGLITGYTGKRTKESLTNEANWVTTEMGTAGIHTSDLRTLIATRPPWRGTCSIPNLTDVKRNEILRNAADCLSAGIAYLWDNDISWNGPTWDGTIADIHEVRCDGLVEVCYELANLEVWGQNGTHYQIQTWPDEHQNLGMNNPQVELSPIVQRGGVANSPTRFVADVLFQPQTLP
jgi:hypothetical protein